MEKLYLSGSWIGTIIGAICWTQVFNVAFEILGLLSVIFSIICSVLNIIAKIKKARQDGKVTAEEMQDIVEAVNDAKETVEKAKNEVK